MKVLMRLRISLVDRVGSLGEAATIIGLHGGNILSIDVLSSGGESAVDDVVAEFAEEPDINDLAQDFSTNTATRLIECAVAHTTDPLTAILDRVVDLLGTVRTGAPSGSHTATGSHAAGPTDTTDGVWHSIALVCAGAACEVMRAQEASSYHAGKLAVEGRQSVTARTSDVPPGLSEDRSEEIELLAIPTVTQATGDFVVFVGRPRGRDFTDREIARLEAIIAVHNRINDLELHA